jgi:endonuclease/exonuclease/phosphatase family metal-dependent hydrolase
MIHQNSVTGDEPTIGDVEPQGSLRVMTWNLWWRFGEWADRERAIVSVIERERPDIVCLQEVWSAGDDSSARRVAAFVGGGYALTDDHFGGRDVGFHNAIVSRWPLDDVESIPLPNGAGEPGHRRALFARVRTPWGSWPVVSTHLDYRFDESAVRQLQTARLAQLVAERRGNPEVDLPVLVGGDCNAVPDSDEIRMLTGRSVPPVPGLVFTDVWEARGAGPGHTWLADHPYQPHTAWPNRRLDYLLVSWPRPKPAGNPISVWTAGGEPVDGVLPSDHLAVVADLVAPDR